MTTAVDPNFKTSLAPRKRARTLEEKEQRRMERILRNRRAAHASREKKRRHVEYLETYVLSLERNYLVMLSNVDTLKDMLPRDQASVSLIEPEDISDLKAEIHLNLSCIAQADLGAVCDTPYSDTPKGASDGRSLSPEYMMNPINPTTPINAAVHVKIEEPEAPFMSTKPTADYYHSYLSPVSINSPTTSSIDLTIKKEPFSPTLDSTQSPVVLFHNSDSIMFGSATLGPDLLAQNSAVILSVREKNTLHMEPCDALLVRG